MKPTYITKKKKYAGTHRCVLTHSCFGGESNNEIYEKRKNKNRARSTNMEYGMKIHVKCHCFIWHRLLLYYVIFYFSVREVGPIGF